MDDIERVIQAGRKLKAEQLRKIRSVIQDARDLYGNDRGKDFQHHISYWTGALKNWKGMKTRQLIAYTSIGKVCGLSPKEHTALLEKYDRTRRT